MTSSLPLWPLAAFALGALGTAVWYMRLRSPTRPLLTCLLDALSVLPQYFKLFVFAKGNDVYACAELAVKQTGLRDFGDRHDGEFLKRYDVSRIAGSTKSKAEYTPFGHILVQSSLTRRLSFRLEFIDYLKKHPKILNIPVKNPIFVIGFPRTGTTFLHEVLGLHKNVRMHHSWEQMSPIPSSDNESFSFLQADLKKRYEGNKRYFQIMLALAGNAIQRVHRIGYDESEECTVPCGMELPWNATELCWVPFAAKEVIPLGSGDAYLFYRKFLQLLSFQYHENAAEASAGDLGWSWMLKCPFHLPYLTELFTAFPDATVVWTHRNPVDCVASACSLYETLLEMGCYSDTIDRKALGLAVLEYTEYSLRKAEESFKAIGLGFSEHDSSPSLADNKTAETATIATSKSSQIKVIHVRYDDSVNKTRDVCRNVFEQSGLTYTDEYAASLDSYLRKSHESREKLKTDSKIPKKGQASNKVHDYHLSDYGLDEEMVRARFKDYIAAFRL